MTPLDRRELCTDASLCSDIDQMISVSQHGESRPIFPVPDAAAILMRGHQLSDERRAELVALISQRCIGRRVPLAFNDFQRIEPI